MGARIAPPFMEATDASRLVCVVVVSYQEYSLSACVCACVCVRWLAGPTYQRRVSSLQARLHLAPGRHRRAVNTTSRAVKHDLGEGCEHETPPAFVSKKKQNAKIPFAASLISSLQANFPTNFC